MKFCDIFLWQPNSQVSPQTENASDTYILYAQ